MEPLYSRGYSQEEDVFVSGDCVPPGLYREIGSNVVILLDHFQPLPSADDGGRIEYRRVSDYPSAGLAS
jgi:hypothetical protein